MTRLDLDVTFGLPVADTVAGYQDFAHLAVELGYQRLWFPETYRLEPVSFAGWAAATFPGHPLGLGPMPAVLRTGPQLAMTLGTLAGMGATDVEVLVGSSSPTMTNGWHNRGRTTVAAMASLFESTRAAASGERTAVPEGAFRSEGFTNGFGAVPLRMGMAAFGPKMLRLAGAVADRVAINMSSPKAIPDFLAEVAEGARAAGRAEPPPLTVWAHVCLDPSGAAIEAAKRLLSGYVRVPGYDRAFVAQGFADLVNAARAAGSAREVRELIPDEFAIEVLGMGTLADIRARLDGYRELGVGIALVPNTADDPGGQRTLRALAEKG